MLDELLCKLLSIFSYKQYKVHETQIFFHVETIALPSWSTGSPFLILQLSQKYVGILVAMYKNL